MRVVRFSAALMASALVGGLLCASPATAEEARSSDEREALAEAADTGERVEVETLRAERREVYANADGTFTAIEHTQPVRVLRAGAWVDTDATLVEHADGTIGPKASTVGLSLSTGGSGPLARLSRAGKVLALDWPGELPEPRIGGTRAVYEAVLPGVDLILRADVDGVSHVLVVESAEAAQHPDLALIRLAIDASGVEVRERPEGGLEAVDTGAGGAVFEAPVPLMWDSGAVEQSEQDAGATTAQRAVVEAEDPDLVEGPSESSKLAEVGVEVAGDDLVLTPDADLLGAQDTVYPVYIDPVWKTATRSSWAMVSSGYPSQKFWKFAGKKDEGTGRCPQLSGDPYYCNGVGTKRVLYGLPTSAYHGKQILSAEFAVTLRHTYNTTAKPVRLYRTGAITSSTTWNNQPAWSSLLDTKSPKNTAGSCTTTNQNARFNATAAVTQAAAGKWATTTFGLRADSESDYTQWKRFCDNAQLEVRYNTAPTLPKQSDLQLSPGGACVYGASRPYVDEPPRISAYLRDPDHSSANVEQVRAQFRVFWNNAAGVEQRREFTTSYKAANSRFYYQIPADIPQNVVIGWIVRAHDGHSWSGWSWDGDQTRCQFVYDATSPAEPVIRSTAYPDDDKWHDGVGSYGNFTISSPSTDVVAYRYGVNTHPSTANTLTPTRAGASVALEFVPEYEGPHSLYVEAVDAAGRVSTRANYMFLVSAGRPAAPHWPLNEASGSSTAADTGAGEWYSPTPAPAGPGVSFGTAGPGGPGSPAALFDGTEDAYLNPDRAYLGLPESSFSLAGWVRLDATNRDQTVLSQDSGEDVDFVLGYAKSHDGWQITFPDYRSSGRFTVAAPGSAVQGVWTHLAVVNDDRRRHATLYVNGRKAAEASFRPGQGGNGGHSAIQSPDGSVAPMALWSEGRIGRTFVDAETFGDHLHGALSDLRAFDRLITADEVHTLYSLPTERVAYWPLNEVEDGTSPEANEGQPLALSGGAEIFQGDDFGEPALIGSGHLVLDGTDGHAFVPAAPTATDGSFTLSVRARLASAAPEQPMTVLSQAGQNQNQLELGYSPDLGRWELALTDSDGATAETTTIGYDTTQPSSEYSGDHLAVVYDAFAREIRFYVNAQLAGNTAVAHTSWAATGPLSLGRALSSGDWSQYFSGAVDDVRVYAGAADITTIGLLSLIEEQPDL
ncbi:LamG-like jellyroll fold domain-containing protein [Nocardiopsis ansamitocini]|uniref:LamG-like jellyroll fold domain-containing protein n=1 Tax=Nocardiopsis ansamitocini TaxID=1670832 RepID=A0A9W6ULB3_9ACTN|nr:LamG-like jellyroll fold domain-containing protein [Nocardiopsis ansamitocini]GLU50537.1 hypothetical protein Nans01_48880 [Nocardiopsis ansamitocini]